MKKRSNNQPNKLRGVSRTGLLLVVAGGYLGFVSASRAACPSIDVVFIMDTSGSMGDEAAALCSDIAQVVTNLATQNIQVNPTILGVTEVRGGPFGCLSDDVVNLLGAVVPGTADTCAFPQSQSAFESWGPATAIVADRFSWTPGALRVIIPISDEGPCNGSFPDGCNDPGDDRDSITNAIAIAKARNVIVSPIAGTAADTCVVGLATDLAKGTGGTAFETQIPQNDLATAITDMLAGLCTIISTCDDGQVCTVNDTMVPSQGCFGTDVNTLPCTSDADCFGSVCNLTIGFCFCVPQPTLCLEPASASLLSGSCVDATQDILVNIVVGASANFIKGGQFLVGYDPAVVDFVAVEAGNQIDPSSPFDNTFSELVDQTAGNIFFAVTTPVFHPGTHGPAIMATLRFRATTTCGSGNISFLNQSPKETILSDANGSRVNYISCGLLNLQITSGPLQLSCPQNVTVNADAGKLSTNVTWTPALATDPCNGQVTLDCTATNDGNVSVDQLLQTGGLFPVGLSTFSCQTSNGCGQMANCSWEVLVRRRNSFEVDVQLESPSTPSAIDRCIEFEFFSQCSQQPVKVSKTLTFGRPFFDFPGVVRNALFEVPAGSYFCVTARDPQHTLRSTANLTLQNGRYQAGFMGDPDTLQEGNWLVGGDLDGNQVIDALDYLVLFSQWTPPNLSPLTVDTTCGATGFNADINGDGFVDRIDASFLSKNFGKTSPASCCATGGPIPPQATLEIPLTALRGAVLAKFRVADLNHDQVLDRSEIDAIVEVGLKNLVKRGRGIPSH